MGGEVGVLAAIQFLTFFLALILYSAWLVTGHLGWLEWALLLLSAFGFLYAVKDVRQRVVLVMFLSSYCLFLVSSVGFHVVGIDGSFMGRDFSFFDRFPSEVVAITLNCLILSLAALLLGFILGRMRPKPVGVPRSRVESTRYLTVMGEVARVLFLVTLPAGLLRVVEKVLFVQAVGYVASYTSYAGAGPIIEKLAAVNTICFFVFLGTLPDKRTARLPMYLYLIVNGMSILSGARNDAVVAALLLTFYYVYRSTIEERQDGLPEPECEPHSAVKSAGSPWIGSRERRFALIAVPVGIALLSAWGYLRLGLSVEDLTLSDFLLGFFKTQGGSINVIAYGISYANYLPDTNISYVFGPIISWANASLLSGFLGQSATLVPHTVDMALNGNNFGQTITYLVMPRNYLAGIGVGSAYIAELFIDFGYAGVAVYNLLLGVSLSRFSRLFERVESPFVLALLMLALQGFLFLPRDVALAWLTNVLNFTTLATFIVIGLIVRLRMHREGS